MTDPTATHGLSHHFEQQRPHLGALAYRLLGSSAEAEDAVQEAWIRLSRADTSAVQNLSGWLTTVVARICLDNLRARATRREQTWEELPAAPTHTHAPSPEDEAVLADAVGAAMLVVLDKLGPSERIAFVLHDFFDLPFAEVSAILGCSDTAARQLASRARRRVRSGGQLSPASPEMKKKLIQAFFAAARDGDLQALLAVLDPEIVMRADAAAVALGAATGGGWAIEPEIRGAERVAHGFLGRARGARLALIDGEWGLAWAPGGKPRALFRFTVDAGHILAIHLVCDQVKIRELEIHVEAGVPVPSPG